MKRRIENKNEQSEEGTSNVAHTHSHSHTNESNGRKWTKASRIRDDR